MEDLNLKTYFVKPGTKHYGDNFELITILQIGLHLLSLSNIKNFQISSNNLAWGNFDDVVFEIILNSGSFVVLAIQLKHTDRNMQSKHFQSPKHDFSLDKYFKTYKDMYEKNNSHLDAVYFVLYTTARCQNLTKEFAWHKSQLTQKTCNSIQYLQNTGICFQFDCLDENLRSRFLSQFFLYTNQLNYEKTFRRLVHEIESKFGVHHSVVDQFLILLERWKNGNFGGNYKISRNEFILELCELLFTPYIQEPTYIPYDNFKHSNLWNKIIETVDVTIIDNTQKLPLVWFLMLEKVNWEKVHQLPMTELRQFLPKHYLLKKQKNNKISDKDLYLIFWKFGLVPLLLIGNDNRDKILSKIIATAKLVPSTHFIVFTKDTEPYQDLSTFTNIFDLSRKSTILFKEVLKNVSVKIQNRFQLSLEEMYNMSENVLSKITPDLLLEMMVGRALDDKVETRTLDIYINRQILSVYLHLKQLTFVTNENVYILCHLHTQLHVLVKQFPERVVEFSLEETFLKHSQNKIVLVEASIQWEVLQNFLRKLNAPYHLFQLIEYVSEYFLKLIEATGPVNRINIVDVKNCVNDSEILSLRDNLINVISASSGMGKTSLVYQMYKTHPEKIWVIKIDLNSIQFCSDTPIDYISSTNYGSDKLTNICFNLFVKKKQVVFLFDGFDELETIHIEKCLDMFENIKKQNIIQWITTKPARSVLLENKFHILPHTISVLDENDKETFFGAYSDKYIEENSKQWFKDNITHVSSNLDPNLTCNPLQVYMICELVKNHTSTPADFDPNNVLLLYEKFIEMKLQIYKQKYVKILHHTVVSGHLKSIVQNIQHCSLIAIFSLTKIRNTLFLEINHWHDQCGIISHISNDTPVFVHNSYAEYFAATWFAQNWQKTPSRNIFFEIYFSENYALFKMFFDRLVSRDLDVFNLILQNNSTQNINFTKDDLKIRDKIGRNVLHLICSLKPRSGSLNSIEVVVKCGLHPSTGTDDFLKLTPFEYAMKYRNTLVIEKLLNFGNFAIDFEAYLGDYNNLANECIKGNCHNMLTQFVAFLNNNHLESTTIQMPDLLNLLLYAIKINSIDSTRLLLNISSLKRHIIIERHSKSIAAIFSAVQNTTENIKTLFQNLEKN